MEIPGGWKAHWEPGSSVIFRPQKASFAPKKRVCILLVRGRRYKADELLMSCDPQIATGDLRSLPRHPLTSPAQEGLQWLIIIIILRGEIQ